MHAAAELPMLIATCFRCQARFSFAAPESCPGCGGAVIHEMDARARARSVVDGACLAEEPAGEPGADRPSYLPGVHLKLAPTTRERLARSADRAGAPRPGGGTSVHAAARGDGGISVKLLSMAAFVASFALLAQVAH